MSTRQYYVYIMTNKDNTALYTGVTNNLGRRVYEHKRGLVGGFTKRYKTVKLVYYEVFDRPEDAIRRERQIKDGSRQRKIDLVNSLNLEWRDLCQELRDCHATLAMTEITQEQGSADAVIARAKGPWQSPAGGGKNERKTTRLPRYARNDKFNPRNPWFTDSCRIK